VAVVQDAELVLVVLVDVLARILLVGEDERVAAQRRGAVGVERDARADAAVGVARAAEAVALADRGVFVGQARPVGDLGLGGRVFEAENLCKNLLLLAIKAYGTLLPERLKRCTMEASRTSLALA
jgi:hypothetical protein